MRSQMAEAFLRHHAGDRFEAASAGTTPAGSVFPEVVEVMRELRIPLDGHTSDPIDPGLVEKAALIVDMTGRAQERIPRAYKDKYVHWPVRDPFGGDENELRRVRDEIAGRVRELVEQWPG
jgi:arsenate reductase (thioredoxin)